MSELDKARAICESVAKQRARWGRHAGFGDFTPEELLDAVMALYEAGGLEAGISRDELSKANRAKGAAEARAKRYKAQLDDANKNIVILTKALEEAAEQAKERTQEALERSG